MLNNLIAQVKRRKFLQTFLPYLGFVWLLLQVVSVIVPMLHLSPLVTTFTAVVLFAGIPVMLYLSWYFNITSNGIEPVVDEDTGETLSIGAIQWLVLIIIIGISGVTGYFYFGEIKQEITKQSEGIKQTKLAESIAVLPLTDTSPGGTQAWLAEGMSETMTSMLGSLSDLKVAAFDSVQKLYRQGLDPVSVARALDTNAILTGTVRHTGNRVRVRIELVNAADAKVIWSQTYVREMQDMFDIESEVARSTLNALQDTFIAKQQTVSLLGTNQAEAYMLYLRGRHALREQTIEALRHARKLFEQAVAVDSDYAQAYVALAETIAISADSRHQYNLLEAPIAIQLANSLLAEAFKRSTNYAQAYVVQGRVFELAGDFDNALSSYLKATSLNPSLASAYYRQHLVYNELGRADDALASLHVAKLLDPESIP